MQFDDYICVRTTMKKLFLLLVLLAGCSVEPVEPEAIPKFKRGQVVYFVVDGRKAMVLDTGAWGEVRVRYPADDGYHKEWVEEFELTAE